MINAVLVSRVAQKQLKKLPPHICDKLDTWVRAVKSQGVEIVRQIPGYHDEPLKGEREGQRSIRLSRSYRALYRIVPYGKAEVAVIEEVSKHEY